MTSTLGAPQGVAETEKAGLATRYKQVRRASEEICHPLAIEDYGVQGMANTSPPRWHLAHTTWFFETFLLKPYLPRYTAFHPQFESLFNSYYETLGAPFPRPLRGVLSRPTTDEIYSYRAYVDTALVELIGSVRGNDWEHVAARITLGCHHEEQHQELLLTDIKYNFSLNPLCPAYRTDLRQTPHEKTLALDWMPHPGGIYEIGADETGFSFDNERPRHRIYLAPYMLASRLVTNGEYLEFITAGGYQRAELWLADGWHTVRGQNWQAPLYWQCIEGTWWQFTLGGMQPVIENAPVCHISYYEADAYARFRDVRLPTEQEWEVSAALQPTPSTAGNFRESDFLHPQPTPRQGQIMQMFGDVWEWTCSAYAPYPGYHAPAGALGEYNGKFMANQMVLRGGSCVTPAGHVGVAYRNFFYPHDRWQFSGIRLGNHL